MALSLPQTIAIATGASLIAVMDYRIPLLAMASLAALSSANLLTRPEQRRHSDTETAKTTAGSSQ
ncbi:hypothetical protein ACWD4F_23100 [Streptomyces aureus]